MITLMQDRFLSRNISFICLQIIVVLPFLFIGCSPKLLNGHYTGTELISVSSDKRYWPGGSKPDTNVDTANRQWFHKVTISVKGKIARIVKAPFYIKDSSMYMSKTDGGYYYYSGDISFDKDDKTFKIFSSLDSCKFCPRFATATPLYTYQSYYIKKSRRNWIVKTDYEKNLTFEKQ